MANGIDEISFSEIVINDPNMVHHSCQNLSLEIFVLHDLIYKLYYATVNPELFKCLKSLRNKLNIKKIIRHLKNLKRLKLQETFFQNFKRFVRLSHFRRFVSLFVS